MNFLLDEQLHDTAAKALDALGAPAGNRFSYIVEHAGHGTLDEDIPALCRRLGVGVLVTANVKDFGARKRYYEALLDQDVRVVVVRFGRAKPTPAIQVSILAGQYARICALLEESEVPCLIRVTASGAQRRTLEELIAEIDERLP